MNESITELRRVCNIGELRCDMFLDEKCRPTWTWSPAPPDQAFLQAMTTADRRDFWAEFKRQKELFLQEVVDFKGEPMTLIDIGTDGHIVQRRILPLGGAPGIVH